MGALKLLAVFPHPDDETMGLGSTLARYSSEGVETYLICATMGERGWFESEGPNPGWEGVANIREKELACAADALGIKEVHSLGYIDGDVDQASPAEIIGRIVSFIRRIKPQVVVSFGPDGIYGHPDHIALSQFTNAALVAAAEASFNDPEKLSPHLVLKFYYMVDSLDMVRLANEEFGGISMNINGVVRSHIGWEEWQITTKLDNSEFVEKVQKAIRCHRSQLPGYGPIADWPLEKIRQVFGEGYFYRAYSLVNGGRKTEKDLFEGLRELNK